MPGTDFSEKVPEKVKEKSVQAIAGTHAIGELEHSCLAWSMCDFGKRTESGRDAWMGGHDLVILRVKNWGSDRQGGP